MKKVLITGADGFLGSHLTEKLVKRECEVYAVIYHKRTCENIFRYTDKIHVIECDLFNSMDIVEELPNDIDVMYHFAWLGVDARSRKDMDIQMKNIQLSTNCIALAVKKGIKRVIVPGSTNEYLYGEGLINGLSAPCPQDAYGSVKTALQFLCRQIARENGIGFIYTIITGIYAKDREDNNVIYYVIKSLLNGQSPSLTKLEQMWDYVYIDDVIEALSLIGEKGIDGKVYAVGKGDNMQLKNYIEIIQKKINPQLPLGIGEIPYLSNTLPSSCMDITELQKDTGYVPKVEFEDGIDEVINELRRKYTKDE